MPIFADYTNHYFLITSYKVAFSTLNSKSNLKLIHHQMDFIMFKHMLKHYYFKRYMLVRNPYDRLYSTYNDKINIQPKRIVQNNLTWENVHKLIFPFLTLKNDTDNTEIFEKFEALSLNRYIELLPLLINKDPHFEPQINSIKISLLNTKTKLIPLHQIFCIEKDLSELTRKTGLEMNIIQNSSKWKKTHEKFDKNKYHIINQLYKADFKLGNYPLY